MVKISDTKMRREERFKNGQRFLMLGLRKKLNFQLVLIMNWLCVFDVVIPLISESP